MKNQSGIYKITCLVNNKIYIGSAVNLHQRRYNHFWILQNNKHHSKHLQFTFNKYGKSTFTFEVLECCEKEDLIKREQYYIDTLKPQLNILKIAGSSLGRKMTKEAILKGQETKKLRGHQFPSKKTRKLLSKRLKASYREGRRVSPFKNKPSQKGIKKGPQSPELIQKRINARDGYRHTKKTKKNISKGHLNSTKTKRNKVYRFDLKNKLINIYNSTQECMRKTKFCNISACCRKERLSYNSYWSYNVDFKIPTENKIHPLTGRKRDPVLVAKTQVTKLKNKLLKIQNEKQPKK